MSKHFMDILRPHRNTPTARALFGVPDKEVGDIIADDCDFYMLVGPGEAPDYIPVHIVKRTYLTYQDAMVATQAYCQITGDVDHCHLESVTLLGHKYYSDWFHSLSQLHSERVMKEGGQPQSLIPKLKCGVYYLSLGS